MKHVLMVSLSLALTVCSSGPNDPRYLQVRRDISEQTRTGMTDMWVADRLLHVTTQDKLHEKKEPMHPHTHTNRKKLVESVCGIKWVALMSNLTSYSWTNATVTLTNDIIGVLTRLQIGKHCKC